jgi:hypothetical protein
MKKLLDELIARRVGLIAKMEAGQLDDDIISKVSALQGAIEAIEAQISHSNSGE